MGTSNLQEKKKLIGCDSSQDARDDVGGAQNAGMLGILVRTGKKKNLKYFTFHPGSCFSPSVPATGSAFAGFSTNSPVIFQVNTGREMRIKSTPLLT